MLKIRVTVIVDLLKVLLRTGHSFGRAFMTEQGFGQLDLPRGRYLPVLHDLQQHLDRRTHYQAS
jgi:hypothetical protein